MAQQLKNQPAMQETQETQVQSLGGEDPLEEENGNPLNYSCLENPTDRGAWQTTDHGVKELNTTEQLNTTTQHTTYWSIHQELVARTQRVMIEPKQKMETEGTEKQECSSCPMVIIKVTLVTRLHQRIFSLGELPGGFPAALGFPFMKGQSVSFTQQGLRYHT